MYLGWHNCQLGPVSRRLVYKQWLLSSRDLTPAPRAIAF